MFSTRLTVLASLFCTVLALPSDLSIRQSASNPNAALPGWTFVGCFTDANPGTRTLQEQHNVNPSMTPALCTQFCASNFATPLNFAGTEFTDECFCDFNIQGTATLVNASQCNFPCGGDSTLTCGGASLISVFQNNNTGVGPLPTNKAQVGNFSFVGCFQDVVNTTTRTLLESFAISTGVTVESCTATCLANGFSIAGLEFGEECWCGNTFALPVANITAPLKECSRACEADHTELCGAANRLSVYQILPPVVTSSSTTAKPTTTTAAPTTTPTTAAPTTTVPTTTAPTTTAKPTTTTPTATATTKTA